MSCPGGTTLMSRAMLTVGAGRIGGAEDLEEGELGLQSRGSLQSRLTRGRETPAHSPGLGAHPSPPPLPGCPAEAATGQHQRQALECPDEPTDAPHRARRYEISHHTFPCPSWGTNPVSHPGDLSLFGAIQGLKDPPLSEKIPQNLGRGETPPPCSLA